MTSNCNFSASAGSPGFVFAHSVNSGWLYTFAIGVEVRSGSVNQLRSTNLFKLLSYDGSTVSFGK